MDKRFGHYSFAVGVLVAILLGIAGAAGFSTGTKQALMSILVILGLIVGALNVTGKETKEFLLSAGVLVIVALLVDFGSLRNVLYIGPMIVDLLNAVISFTIPAVIIVAIKNIVRLSRT